MSPIMITKEGYSEWVPNGEKSLLNFNKHNEKEIFEKTVQATERIIGYYEKGILSGEDFVYGLEKNAQHLGIPPELLLDLASNNNDSTKSNIQ